MTPSFSFTYRDRFYHIDPSAGTPMKGGIVYTVEDGIEITLVEKHIDELDAVHWTIYFENKTDTDSGIFSDISDCHTTLPLTLPVLPKQGYRPVDGDLCVITMQGMVDGNYYWESDQKSAQEYTFVYEYLDKAPNKTKSFSNIGGRSSEGMMPFFDVTASGDGYVAAIGWTGDWKSEFSRGEDGVTMKSGLKETRFYLKAGERVRTSSTLIMRYEKGEDKHNKFRQLIKTHFSHKTHSPSARDGLLACELWGGLTSEEMKKRIRELSAHGIRFEDVWIDAGWYGKCTKCDDAFSGDWSQCTGDWQVNTRVHPEQLRDVAACANDAGMRLMLWLEPERALSGTEFYQKHPDWFLSLKDNPHHILNYGNEDALDHVYELVAGYVKELGLSCYRQDFNIQLTDFFRESDAPDRRGISEIRHITGMYRLWDRLLTKFPELIIDNCASGGRRIDIETLMRSIPFFRSDYQCNFNENPEVLQVHNACSSAYLPYVGCTSKTKCDTYAIRSAYASSFGGAFYNAIFQSMNEEDFAWAKGVCDEYRRIRRYFHRDFYNHGSRVFDSTAWTILQYHDPDTDSGIVMAFRREHSPFASVTLHLKGLQGNQSYLFERLNDSSSHLGTDTLSISLPEPRTSVIYEYKRA